MASLAQMQALLGLLVLVVAVFVAAQRTFGRRGQRPSINSDVMGVMDEVFSPARHTAALELRSQLEQGAVDAVPDGWPPSRADISAGKVRLSSRQTK